MTSQKPYLLRAIYDWLLDNNVTPQILVNTSIDSVIIPQEYYKQEHLVLNISPQAVQNLQLGNDVITFNARFQGIPFEVEIPLIAIEAIYAKENNHHGLIFSVDLPPDQDPPKTPTSKTKPQLKVVK